MNLPFTTEQFLNFFKEYNQGIWPVQSWRTSSALPSSPLSSGAAPEGSLSPARDLGPLALKRRYPEGHRCKLYGGDCH